MGSSPTGALRIANYSVAPKTVPDYLLPADYMVELAKDP